MSEPLDGSVGGASQVEVEEGGSPVVPSAEEQRQQIEPLLEDEPALKVGQTWYLISEDWMDRYIKYLQDPESGSPDPIDNTNLLDEETGQLKRTVLENTHYRIISAEAWELLASWYPPRDASTAIPRKVVSKWYSKTVELHLLHLIIIRTGGDDPSKEYHGYFSKAAKLRSVLKEMCARIGINTSDVQMWDYYHDKRFKRLNDIDATLDEERIQDGQKILFEEKVDGRWPKSNAAPKNTAIITEPGICGLTNLGNTCFMNSGLQCLSNSFPLARLFVSQEYKAQINTDNPLGQQGEFALEFGDLLTEMWGGTCKSTAPRDFKWKLERVAPQFAGWQQHDAQELLATLLDGLSEDLNRVKKKPYFESNEFEDLEPVAAAQKTWDQHVARNDSHIIDLFHGQFRSRLDCPDCPRISTTYDPMGILSVPLPQPTTRTIEMFLWPVNCVSIPRKIEVQVPLRGDATITDLKAILHEQFGTNADPTGVFIADIYSHKIFGQFKNAERIAKITDRDTVHVYQIEPVSAPKEGESHDYTTVDVFVLFKGARPAVRYGTSHYYTSSYSTPSVYETLVGNPVIVKLPATTTYGEALESIKQKLGWLFKEAKKDGEQENPAEPKAAEVEVEGEEGETDSSEDAPQSSHPVKLYLSSKTGALEKDAVYDPEAELLVDRGDFLVLSFQEKDETVDVEAFDKYEEPERAAGADVPDSVLTLQKCIELFSTKEVLEETEMWYCNKCKEHKQASKEVDLWKLPAILLVHLKRFSYKSRHFREKLQTLVNYPVEGLDMAPFLKGPVQDGEQTIYDLYAVSNHFGALGGGHYTAYAKNHNNKKWYNFDDSHVSEIDPSRVVTPAAYVLFYAKRGFVDENEKMPLSKAQMAELQRLQEEQMDVSDDDDNEEQEEEENGMQNALL